MNTKGVKSYSSCYLYNKIPDYERAIMQFVMKSERINKQSESFRGVIDDVKRRQSTAVISRVLMREDVVLCISNRPMPAAFKVFICNDLKEDRTPKVFIDCTGLITMKNGYFVIDKIDILCTYLLGAMDCLVYQYDERRIVSNSSIIQSGTECFVSLASHIFDYFRPNGYAENRNKIAYILGMYFQVQILGLDHDQSTCALAARVAGMKTSDIKALEIYYADEDLMSIHNLITSISNTFKMNGIGTDVFVEKWTWFYGVGTQFAMELFSAFAVMLTNAYCGSYVNNQKSIEKCCGRSMVNFSNAMIRVGAESIDRGFRYESASVRDDLDAKKSIKDKVETTKEKLSDKLKKAKKVSESYIVAQRSGYNNIISNTIKSNLESSKIVDRDECASILSESIVNLTKMLNENDRRVKSKEETKSILEDCKLALSIIDPESHLIKESNYYFDREKEIEYTKTSKAISEGVFGDTLKEVFSEEAINENIVQDAKKKIDNLADMRAQWKKSTGSFVTHKWIYRYVNESQKAKIQRYYNELQSDEISYVNYKRYFKQICRFMGIPSDKVIIENIVFEKDKKDKDQDIVALKYSKGSVKVDIPDGVRLIHVSPAENINELVPSYRSKVKGKYLYPSKRVFFTVTKEIKPNKAGLEKQKTYKYTPKDQIKTAYIDPTYNDYMSGSVFVETIKPIPVLKFESLMQRIFDNKGGEKNE